MLTEKPLNDSYDKDKVLASIDTALEMFYEALIKKLDDLKLSTVLKRKNPYLYKAKGLNDIDTIVESILAAFVSSSEETIFGNTFFEPLALVLSGGQKAMSEGMDITVDKGDVIYSIAVKSGTSVFNADSRKRQEQNFQAAQKRANQAHKSFFPVVGYGYGKKREGKSLRTYKEFAGKDFWHWLSGEEKFYAKIIHFMGNKPEQYAQQFNDAYYKAKNRLLREFTVNYCSKDGAINWDLLLEFNSGG